jgi:shikimate dehydrogenase
VRLAVLGDPIAHSLSPAIHAAFLAAADIPGTYTARRVDASGMVEAIAEVRGGMLDGANVTMPHKQLASRLADRVSPLAARTGAVNTWTRIGGEVAGHNTDVVGFLAAWKAAGLPDEAPVLLLGAGGAAAAAAVALDGKRLVVSARHPDRAAEMLRLVRVPAETAPWGEPVPGAVVVNATPVGRHGEELADAVLAEASGLLDMAYGRAATPAVAGARARGIPVADGATMLVAQAAESFRLWTGRIAAIDAAMAAVERALGGDETRSTPPPPSS